jgi:hypothetical protein
LHRIFARGVVKSGPAVVDPLLSNANPSDWFFARVNDSVTGKNNNDVITTIS